MSISIIKDGNKSVMAHEIDWFSKTNSLKIHKWRSVETQTDGHGVIPWKWHLNVMKPCDIIFFLFVLKLIFVLQALLTDCKPTGLYQQDEGCPAESKGGGSMPSVWVKSPTEPRHIRRISNMEIGTGEFQKSPQVLQWSQELHIAIKKRFWPTDVSLLNIWPKCYSFS